MRNGCIRLSTACWFTLLLTGCWSHYGIAVDIMPPPRREIRVGVEAGRITDADITRAKALVAEIAARHRMERSETTIPGNDFDLVVFFAGPYASTSERLSHPAGGMRLSLWVRTDRSLLSVWIVDWRGIGVTERLQTLRSETEAALESSFPGYPIRIEEQRLGFWAP